MKKHAAIILILVLGVLFSACDSNHGTDNSEPEEILGKMTLEEKVWQMFFVAPEDIIDGINVAVQAGDATRRALESCPVGGIIYFGQNIESREQLSEMIANTKRYSKISLFISVDEEGGSVARLGNADIIEKKPPMADIGAMGDAGIEEAGNIGVFLGTELSEIGFNMDFAPVADVMTVESNEDIKNRSFGTDPYLAAKMVAAEVEGLQSQNVSAVIKHFPGNGSTETNTHYGTGVCTRTPEEMRECEFIPFKAGIDAGADAVMVAHMAAVNLAGENIPSTLSPVIIQDYLRGELGFDKLVISDALNMGAITQMYSPEDAVVMAVNAGVDILLMSTDVKKAANTVIEKVRSGDISEDRIDESVLRILTVKKERGIL